MSERSEFTGNTLVATGAPAEVTPTSERSELTDNTLVATGAPAEVTR